MAFCFPRTVTSMARLGRAALLGTFLAGLAGCASFAALAPAPEQLVAERAEARWRALIAGDWEKAYGYSTPAFRSAIPLSGYMNMVRSAVTRKEVAVRGVTCADGMCEATVKLFFQAPMSKGVTLDTEVRERWIEEDGIWYIYVKN